MQFLEGLSDRAAVISLKFRLDWKIAFELPLDYKGFHPTTLVHFRERLIENKQATCAFDAVIEHLKKCGLVKARSKQRVDSTHIIGCVQKLSRIDLLQETLRLFCKDVKPYSELMNDYLTSQVERYLSDILTRGISDSERDQLTKEAGQTMKGFLLWAELPRVPSEIKALKSYQTLKIVFEQNFDDDGPDSDPRLKKVSTGKDHISSPHEPEARYASKGGKGWLGYKGEVVETVNGAKEVNFLTHIDIIEATDYDGDSVPDIIEELQEMGIVPAELYGDTHYNTSDNIENLEQDDIVLKGPVAEASKKSEEKNKGFEIREKEERVICPQGIESSKFKHQKNKNISAVFPKEECFKCSRREVCKPEPRGKRFEARLPNRVLLRRREQMKDPEYREDLHKRNGVEGSISGLVRGQKWRRSRYRGKNKTRLQAKFTGAAANIVRLHRKREMDRERREKETLMAA